MAEAAKNKKPVYSPQARHRFLQDATIRSPVDRRRRRFARPASRRRGRLRDADNAKDHVWQQPDTTGNTDMVRVMSTSPRYPHGYVRYYNSHGQPIGINGKPGSRAETHMHINPDGTHQTPQGWHHA